MNTTFYDPDRSLDLRICCRKRSSWPIKELVLADATSYLLFENVARVRVCNDLIKSAQISKEISLATECDENGNTKICNREMPIGPKEQISLRTKICKDSAKPTCLFVTFFSLCHVWVVI